MQSDRIWNRARADLVVTTELGDEDLFLWEHSARVARNAQQIAKLPAVQALSPDEGAILGAALYHEAGWIARFKEGAIRRDEILMRPLSDADREQGSLILERSLSKLLPRDSLTRAVQAVRLFNERVIESIEGQVITEADNLDEFGVLSLWATVRRGVVDGKAVQAAIDTWRRRKEYRFWEARLKDAFRFDEVRRVATKRLEKLERLMQELEEQHEGADIVLRAAVKSSTRTAKSSLV